jgi:hypothetical protein
MPTCIVICFQRIMAKGVITDQTLMFKVLS